MVTENGISPVTAFFRSLNLIFDHTDPAKTENDKPNLNAVAEGKAKDQPIDAEHRDDDEKSTSSDNSSVILLSEDRIQHLRRRSTQISIAGEPPVQVSMNPLQHMRKSMFGMADARRFSMAADNSTPSLDIVSDTEMEVSSSLEEATMKVITPTAFNHPRQKEIFHDARTGPGSTECCIPPCLFPHCDRIRHKRLQCSTGYSSSWRWCYEKAENFSDQFSPCMRMRKRKSARLPRISATFGSGPPEVPRHAPPLIEIDNNLKLSAEIITSSETKPPDRGLLLRMIDAQRLLSQANKRI